MKKIITIIFILIGIHSIAQISAIDSLSNQIELAIFNRKWDANSESEEKASLKIDKNKIIVFYCDRFRYNSKCCPENLSKTKQKNLKIDTISITFSIEPNWTEEKRINQTEKNKIIIDELTTKFINYNDGIDWKSKFCESKSLFLENPMFYLSRSKIIDKEKLNQIIRIPDFIFNKFGVFIDYNFNPFFISIIPYRIEENLNLFIQDCSKIDKKINNLFDGQANY